jgi:hypothetical protein
MRWRLLAHPKRLPLNRPVIMWQIISHKVGRLLLPFLAILAFVANCAEVTTPGARRSRAPVALLTGQVAFYLLAAVGPRLRLRGRIGKFMQIPRYLVVTNAATLEGLLLATRETNMAWDRVARYENGT